MPDLPILATAIAMPTVPPPVRDDLLDDIKAATSIDLLLGIAKKRLEITHVINIFKCLFELQKQDRCVCYD